MSGGVSPTATSVRVLENRPRGPALFELSLLAPAGWGPALAGQFVQLECPPRELFGLRRPFSLSDCRPHPEGTELRVLYGVVGRRTGALAGVAPGEGLELTGPLGRPFLPFPGRRPVMLGGGRGIAPILLLARQWCGPAAPDGDAAFPSGSGSATAGASGGSAPAGDPEKRGLLVQAARTAALLLPIESPPCALRTATDDGTAGFAGTILELLEALLRAGSVREGEDALYACGPNRMLAALSRWVEGRDLPCQVSLETHFGCGLGLCAGCAVPVRARPGGAGAFPAESAPAQIEPGETALDAFGRYVFACREGPVFESWRIEWEGVHE